MKTNLVQTYEPVINRILLDVYEGAVNMGLVTDFIPAGLNTTDFDLPDNRKVRIKEQGNKVFYNVFRSK